MRPLSTDGAILILVLKALWTQQALHYSTTQFHETRSTNFLQQTTQRPRQNQHMHECSRCYGGRHFYCSLCVVCYRKGIELVTSNSGATVKHGQADVTRCWCSIEQNNLACRKLHEAICVLFRMDMVFFVDFYFCVHIPNFI